MLRIAMLSEHASPLAAVGGVDAGGQNVYVAQLTRQLARRGHAVDVFTRRCHPDEREVVDFCENGRVVHVPAGPAAFVRKEELLRWMPGFAAFVEDFWRRGGRPYDIVHANFWMSGLAACRLKAALGRPFVVTFHALGRVRLFHQGAADGFPRERLRVEQRVIDEADCVIAECPQDEEDLTTLYRADARRIAQIPCGYDPEEMHPVAKRLARRIAGLPENGRLLLQLGRLVPRKGVDNVIRALGRLVHDHRLDARLAIVGGASEAPDDQATPEIERLRCVAKRERVESRVLFLGRKARERLKYYYSAADVFVSTPWYEPFGMTPLEAMACGRPVVGSDVGGIKSTVADGRTGHLVPVDDPRALAAVLARLYRHPLRLRSLGRRSLRRAARFTWTRVTDAVEKVYEEILSHGKIPTSRIYR